MISNQSTRTYYINNFPTYPKLKITPYPDILLNIDLDSYLQPHMLSIYILIKRSYFFNG